MSLSTLFTSLGQLLSEQTGLPARLGCPDQEEPGLYLWPWRLAENKALGYLPARHETDPAALEQRQFYAEVDFLVFTCPVLTSEGLASLEAARQAIFEHPLLRAEGQVVQLNLNPIDPETLSQVCLAAGIPLALCLSVTARFLPGPARISQP